MKTAMDSSSSSSANNDNDGDDESRSEEYSVESTPEVSSPQRRSQSEMQDNDMRIAGNGSSSFIAVPCEVASPEMIGIYRRRKSE
jgi:type III secretory pathway component EscU